MNLLLAQHQVSRYWWAVWVQGDLEILMEPNLAGKLSIAVTTSVDGSEQRWKNVFERMFTEQTPPAVHIEIHDFGATPGVVRLRLEQAFEEVNCG